MSMIRHYFKLIPYTNKPPQLRRQAPRKCCEKAKGKGVRGDRGEGGQNIQATGNNVRVAQRPCGTSSMIL